MREAAIQTLRSRLGRILLLRYMVTGVRSGQSELLIVQGAVDLPLGVHAYVMVRSLRAMELRSIIKETLALLSLEGLELE
jgi:hypothetical protein